MGCKACVPIIKFPSELTVAVEVPMTIGGSKTDAIVVALLGGDMLACVDSPAKVATALLSLEDWSSPTSWMSELRVSICTPLDVPIA